MELIENANKEALERFFSAESVLVDVVPAREAILRFGRPDTC